MAKPLYIINFEGIAYHPQLVAEYHQHIVLYIIKPQRKCTLTRDEIQPYGLRIYTALRAVMIYQTCGLDKKIPRTKFSEFFGSGIGIRTPTNRVRVCCATFTQFRYIYFFYLSKRYSNIILIFWKMSIGFL